MARRQNPFEVWMVKFYATLSREELIWRLTEKQREIEQLRKLVEKLETKLKPPKTRKTK